MLFPGIGSSHYPVITITSCEGTRDLTAMNQSMHFRKGVQRLSPRSLKPEKLSMQHASQHWRSARQRQTDVMLQGMPTMVALAVAPSGTSTKHL